MKHYGIVRVQKFKADDVRGIQIHDRRESENSSNKDIDKSRTHLNYNLHTGCDTFTSEVKKKIDALNLKKAVRKDAVVMAQVLVTSDKAYFDTISEKEREQFFLDAYIFLCNRYGKDNVVSAVVHLDETGAPHMHFNFVPIRDGRLSAKVVLNKTDLIKQQDDFYSEVGKKYGLLRGEQGGKKKHLDTIDYKIKTKKQELERITEALQPVEQVEHTKTFTGKVKLSEADFEALSNTSAYANALKYDNDMLLKEIERLERQVQELKPYRDINNTISKAERDKELDILRIGIDIALELPGFKQMWHNKLKKKYPHVTFDWEKKNRSL